MNGKNPVILAIRESSGSWYKDPRVFKAMDNDDNFKPLMRDMRRTQVRKIYEQFLYALRASDEDLPVQLNMLRARFRYARARDNLTDNFLNLLLEIVNKMEQDLRLLQRGELDANVWKREIRQFLEAFYAYSYIHAPRK